MGKYITLENAKKTAWMILEGLGFWRSSNQDLSETVDKVFDTAPVEDVMERRSGRWIAQFDNGCRMWACPECGGRMRGDFYNRDLNPYHYCPYCGIKLHTKILSSGFEK